MNSCTPRAQQVLKCAIEEATRLNRDAVDTEHLLLGLLKLGQGVPVNVLRKSGLDLNKVRAEVERNTSSSGTQKASETLPYTETAKRALGFAVSEAKALHYAYIGTEHIFLGVLREEEGTGARVLQSLGVEIKKIRQEIVKELDPNFPGS
jgi:ATP-dependent Clp protease ATP-binding subunit ClpC